MTDFVFSFALLYFLCLRYPHMFFSESNIGRLFSIGYFTTRDICSEMIQRKTSQTNSMMLSSITGEKCPNSGVNPGFPIGGSANPPVGGGTPTYNFV